MFEIEILRNSSQNVSLACGVACGVTCDLSAPNHDGLSNPSRLSAEWGHTTHLWCDL